MHRNVLAPDAATARHIGSSHAADEGVELVVAAVIGAGGQVLPAMPILERDVERPPRIRSAAA